MKINCTIIKAEGVARWSVLIKNWWPFGKKETMNFELLGDLVGWWLSIKCDSCFCCTSSPLPWASKPVLGLCPVILIISDFRTCCYFNFFTSVFILEWLAKCFSLFWRDEFDIKSFTIELILLISIDVFLYQMFVKWFTIYCK